MKVNMRKKVATFALLAVMVFVFTGAGAFARGVSHECCEAHVLHDMCETVPGRYFTDIPSISLGEMYISFPNSNVSLSKDEVLELASQAAEDAIEIFEYFARRRGEDFRIPCEENPLFFYQYIDGQWVDVTHYLPAYIFDEVNALYNTGQALHDYMMPIMESINYYVFGEILQICMMNKITPFSSINPILPWYPPSHIPPHQCQQGNPIRGHSTVRSSNHCGGWVNRVEEIRRCTICYAIIFRSVSYSGRYHGPWHYEWRVDGAFWVRVRTCSNCGVMREV